MLNIGILAFQGSVAEHKRALAMIEGVSSVEVRTKEDLDMVSGLIIPGGESTTIGKLVREYGLAQPIVQRAKEGMPIWGTCAGMILMAKEIVGEQAVHLGIMDITVRRNAYGSQLDSFCSDCSMPLISNEKVPLVFIRAPWVESVGNGVDILAELDGKIIAARQGNMLATSFHPELTKDLSFHRYIAEMAKAYK